MGCQITIPTQKQAEKIYEKRTEQYQKIKDTYGPTITPDPHQMSLVPLKATPVSPDTLHKNKTRHTQKYNLTPLTQLLRQRLSLKRMKTTNSTDCREHRYRISTYIRD